jgi:hypothetical protein
VNVGGNDVATCWRELLPWAALGSIVALLLVWLVPADIC